MKVAVVPIGTRGDVQPMLALAQGLRAAGHDVRVGAPPNFRAWIESLGFSFEPVGVDLQAYLREHAGSLSGNPLTIVRAARAFLAEQLRQQFVQTAKVAEGADVILGAGLQLAAPSIAEHQGIPCVGVVYAPNLLRSALHAPPFYPWQGLSPWLNRLLWRTNSWVWNGFIRGPLNVARRGHGMRPIPDIVPHLFELDILVAAESTFAPSDPAWTAKRRTVGFLYLDDPTPLDPALDAWLSDGEPPVFVGFGSMSTDDTPRVQREVMAALRALKRRVLLSAGWAGLGADGVPEGWRVIADAPHAALFPRCAAIVHHGGSGTTAQALRAGVPQVVVPHALDQFYFGERVRRLGLGSAPLPVASLRAERLRLAVEHALAIPKDRCVEAASKVDPRATVEASVRFVEAIVAARTR
ncbi:MAG: glycosyltransferase [Polyangiales bacterium]